MEIKQPSSERNTAGAKIGEGFCLSEVKFQGELNVALS
jgi:hypothetical protein